MPVPFLAKWASLKASEPSISPISPKLPAEPRGPECGLPILPNELIPAVLRFLDSRSLSRVAQVSKRFNEIATRTWLVQHGVTPSQLSAGHAVVRTRSPIDAFIALRIALFLRTRPLHGLTCILPASGDPHTVLQLDALLTFFSPPRVRLNTTELDFGTNMVPHAVESRSLSKALTKVVCTVTSDCPVTVFVLKDGLFTCRADGLKRWSPATGHYEGGWAEKSYASIHMHDGSRQRVPTIRTLQTLSVTYPLSPSAPAPFDTWKLVVVDAASLTNLQLTINLASHEWEAILDALTLPALACVGLWAPEIRTDTSTRFFNRHLRIRTIKYMSPTVDALSPGTAPLRLPALESLNTLVPYALHVFGGGAEADTETDTQPRFPHLALVELRPHPRLPDALRLLATLTPGLGALALWSLPATTFSFAAAHAPDALFSNRVFPSVRRLTLNECTLPPPADSGFPALLARAFPSVTKVEVNYSWGANENFSRGRIRKEQGAFVELVQAANPGVRAFLFDGREQGA